MKRTVRTLAALAALLVLLATPVAPVADTLPEWIVEVDWTRSGVWVDISETEVDGETVGRVRNVEWQRGKNDDYGRYEAGTATIVLDNRDRWLEADFDDSPWYPNVKPSRPIRIRARWDPDADPVFTGSIESIPPSWEPSGSEASVTITAVDDLGGLAARRAPTSVWAATVAAGSPLSWWRFGETYGTTAYDSAGDSDATWEGGATYNAREALVAGEPDGAIEFTGTTAAVVAADGGPSTTEYTIEAWLNIAPVDGGAHTDDGSDTIYAQEFPDGGSITLAVQHRSSTETPGGLQFFDSDGLFAFSAVQSTVRVDDSRTHHVVARRDAAGEMTVWVDGVDVTTTYGGNPTVATSTPAAGRVELGRGPSTPVGWDAIIGTLDEIVVYEASLDDATIGEHYAAGSDPWAGDTTGERVERLLTLAGFTSADWNVDPGRSTMRATALNDSLLALVQAAEDAEGGEFYFTAGGTPRFRDRDAAYDDPRSSRVQVVFGDRWDTLDEVAYLSVDPAFGVDQVVNTVTASNGAGVTVSWVDDDSVDEYGEHAADLSIPIDGGRSDLLERASWLVASKSVPRLRLRSVTIAPAFDAARLWPLALGLDIGDRVAFRKHPPGGGDPVDVDMMVVGKSGASPAGQATVTFTLGPVPLEPFAWADDEDGSGVGLGWSEGGVVGGVWTF